MREEGTVEFDDVTATVETDKALLCVIDGKNHWIPKSQIHDDSFVFQKGHVGKLVITDWMAERLGLT